MSEVPTKCLSKGHSNSFYIFEYMNHFINHLIAFLNVFDEANEHLVFKLQKELEKYVVYEYDRLILVDKFLDVVIPLEENYSEVLRLKERYAKDTNNQDKLSEYIQELKKFKALKNKQIEKICEIAKNYKECHQLSFGNLINCLEELQKS